MINANAYKKIIKSYDEQMEDWELFGFIIEQDNKYFMRNLVGEEGLVYDFDVNVGDTVFINNPFGFISFEVAVTNIDSIFIEPANEYRKRITLFEFENLGNEEYWIEGIGSLAGITQSGWDMTLLTGLSEFTLLCYYEESELTYKDYSYPVCFYPSVGISSYIHIEMDFNIFPNPVKDISSLILDNPNHQKLTIKIFNSIGSLINEHHVESTTKIKIHSSAYPKGVYFYQVIQGNQQIFNSKFIVL